MKKVFKIFLVFIILNLLFLFTVVGYAMIGILSPALKNTDIKFTDLLHKNLDEDKYIQLQQSLNQKSAELGTNSANYIFRGLEKVFIPVDFSSIKYEPDFPYSIDDVVNENDRKAEEAKKQALEQIKE